MTRLISLATVEEFKLFETSVEESRVIPHIQEAQDLDLAPLLGDALFNDLVNSITSESFVLYYTLSGGSPAFQAGETITGDNGAVATINTDNGTNTMNLTPVSGDWKLTQTITGGTSGAEATITTRTFGKYFLLPNGDTYVDPSGHTIVFPGLRASLAYWTFSRFILRQSINVTSHGVMEKTNPYSQQTSDKKIASISEQARSGAIAYYQKAVQYLSDKNTSVQTYAYWYGSQVRKKGAVHISVVDRFSSRSIVDTDRPQSPSPTSSVSNIRYCPVLYSIADTYSYTIPELLGKTILSFQLDNLSLIPPQYTLVGSTVTMDSGEVPPITTGMRILIGYQV